MLAALYVASGLCELAGGALVVLSYFDARARARAAVDQVGVLDEYFAHPLHAQGLGAAGPNAEWALRIARETSAATADTILVDARRAGLGALLVGVGIVLGTFGNLAAL